MYPFAIIVYMLRLIMLTSPDKFRQFLAAAIARFHLFPYGYLKEASHAADALLLRERGDKVPLAIGARPAQLEGWLPPAALLNYSRIYTSKSE